MSQQILLRRSEVMGRLQERGLTYRQARRAIRCGAIPQAVHKLHTQARWWKADVDKFDCVAFLETVNHDGGGEQGSHPSHRAAARN